MWRGWLGLQNLWRSLLGAIIFYTILPIPSSWQPSFHRIARWCPFVGLIIGSTLSLAFWGLSLIEAPNLLKSALLVSLWLGLTGGLHLDGAMDTADGLAVMDPERRLSVMSDSVTGAFGVMAAGIILLLKFSAITAISIEQWWILLLTPVWGRWSQVIAIIFYPYLKPDGKGAFHKKNIKPYLDFSLATVPYIILSLGLLCFYSPSSIPNHVIYTGISIFTGISLSFWFYRKLQGHTGDTYGAIVEWTESLILATTLLILR